MSTPSKDPKTIQRMFDEISPKYDFLNHLFTANRDKKWRRKAVEHFRARGLAPLSQSAPTILDLASGTGDFAKEFLRLNPQAIYSVDISPKMLEINKKKLNFENHVSVQADAEALPFEDSFFDVAGAAFGVRNFEHLENCIKEVHRVLKPGGKFVTIEMFAAGNQNGLFGWYFKKVIPKIGNWISKSEYAYDYLFDSVDSFISVDDYSGLLERNGFKIEKIVNNFAKIVYTIYAARI